MSSSSSSRWAWRCSSKCGISFSHGSFERQSHASSRQSPNYPGTLCAFCHGSFFSLVVDRRGRWVYWVTSRLVVILDAYPMRQETHLFSERGTPSYLVGGQNDGKFFFLFSFFCIRTGLYRVSLCFSKQRLTIILSLVCVGWGVTLSRQSDVPNISDLFLTRV